MLSSHFHLRDWLFADEAVVLIIAVILGVPPEVVIEVHVKVGLALRLLVVLPVGEGHHLPSDPLDLLVPVDVHGTQPVVGSVLGVDHSQDALDEVVLRPVQDVGQVGPGLVTFLLRPEVILVVAGEEIAVTVVVNPAQAVPALRSCGGSHSVLQHEPRGEVVQQPDGAARVLHGQAGGGDNSQGEQDLHHLGFII